jgi:hypothetical protein
MFDRAEELEARTSWGKTLTKFWVELLIGREAIAEKPRLSGSGFTRWQSLPGYTSFLRKFPPGMYFNHRSGISDGFPGYPVSMHSLSRNVFFLKL